MSLVVETGAGLLDAESYVSVVDADAYHAARGNAAWTGDAGAKEVALRRATEHLDGAYRMRWAGQAATPAQALCWPRAWVLRADGGPTRGYLPSDAVPQAVVRATCECALREIVSPGGLAPDQYPGEVVASESLGPISVEYASGGAGGSSADTAPVLTAVERILAPVLRSAVGALVLRA